MLHIGAMGSADMKQRTGDYACWIHLVVRGAQEEPKLAGLKSAPPPPLLDLHGGIGPSHSSISKSPASKIVWKTAALTTQLMLSKPTEAVINWSI